MEQQTNGSTVLSKDEVAAVLAANAAKIADLKANSPAPAGKQASKGSGKPQGKPETLEETVARLKAENEALRAAKPQTGNLSLKVSGKGAVSVYGLGKFPVTLYREQWEKLIGHTPEIQGFIKANSAALSVKDRK